MWENLVLGHFAIGFIMTSLMFAFCWDDIMGKPEDPAFFFAFCVFLGYVLVVVYFVVAIIEYKLYKPVIHFITFRWIREENDK